MEAGNVWGPREDIDAILQRIFSRRGFDIRVYKMPDLQRRISRRIDILGISSLTEYAQYLDTYPGEYEALLNVIVNITEFFRDPEAWSFIRAEVLTEILEGTDEIRIWSAGCASGEEPYSIAIALAETLGTDMSRRQARIYATDVDETALKLARGGTYSLDQLSGVSEDIRNRYFVRNGDVYNIARNIRDLMIFSKHNLILDPPIPHIDLLLCRNVLIYFKRTLQSNIIPKLHYALNENGYLWLGKAETPATGIDELKLFSAKWRIFKKLPSVTRLHPGTSEGADRYTRAELMRANKRLEQIIQDIGVGLILLDENFSVVVCNKAIRDIWNLLPEQILGRSFFDLEMSYCPISLKDRVQQVAAREEPAVIEDVECWITRDDQSYLRIEIAPMASGIMISVADATAQYEVRKELQIMNAALESENEELMVANEELRRANIELQSIDEELQCTNEEIVAANEELNARIAELSALKRYMKWL